MEKDYYDYLADLFEWGEKLKNEIMSSKITEEEKLQAIFQVEQWQEKIQSLIGSTIPELEDEERLLELRNEGEAFISDITRKKSESIPYGKHQLPPLPYSYNALEPYISEQIMRLHHTKHHQSYVDGLNKAETALYIDKKEPVKHWLREQAFHGSGHNLHTIFWYNMTPNGKKKPSGEILRQIEKDFGSWAAFQKLFTSVANSVEGNGWAVLYWSPRSGKLAIQSFEKHQLFQVPDTIPLLVLDVWEHAYYLQHKNDKKTYIENWWNVVNWENVNKRLKEARKVKWELY
ncbi:superoxide dismutase, Fe-Mn family [Gracilibacillus ureilyticus]|uniref:superoxide dismutase n=1 Tax=Gracilibacillus ureilyticus TaxID=531814 RepID=A0A1H9PRP8_9BACI|nr:superoxide dismutase [Gracilibacillus ureilyticus]SER50485.1 superoxide dismutase, Fe-Mn family [Gracilibacillus ureilyticus]